MARPIAAASVSMCPASAMSARLPDRMPPTTSAAMYPVIRVRGDGQTAAAGIPEVVAVVVMIVVGVSTAGPTEKLSPTPEGR